MKEVGSHCQGFQKKQPQAVTSSFPVGDNFRELNIQKNCVILFNRILGTTGVVLFLRVKTATVS